MKCKEREKKLNEGATIVPWNSEVQKIIFATYIKSSKIWKSAKKGKHCWG